MRWFGVLLSVVVLAGPTGCGNGSNPSTPSAQLKAAVDRTLAADSFHVEVSSPSADVDSTASSDYEAPDRLRTVTADGFESIAIGDTVYVSDPGRPNHFWSFTSPDASPAGSLVALLRTIGDAGHVERAGDFLVAALAGEMGTARVMLHDGFVVRIELETDSGDEHLAATYELSRFGSADEVAAPPADRVTELAEAPPCPTEGSAVIGVLGCRGGQEPSEVELPPPAQPAESTLQLRPVREDAPAGCSEGDTNPPASTAAVMADLDGACLTLDVAGLEVARVADVDAWADGDDVTLGLTLTDDDARRLDEMAAANVGRRVALVIFGQVLSTPTFHVTKFDGRIAIPGLTIDQAARVKAALT